MEGINIKQTIKSIEGESVSLDEIPQPLAFRRAYFFSIIAGILYPFQNGLTDCPIVRQNTTKGFFNFDERIWTNSFALIIPQAISAGLQ